MGTIHFFLFQNIFIPSYLILDKVVVKSVTRIKNLVGYFPLLLIVLWYLLTVWETGLRALRTIVSQIIFLDIIDPF